MRALWQEKAWRRATLPRATPAVPSPLVYLTSVFGMVTGVTPPLWPPGKSERTEEPSAEGLMYPRYLLEKPGCVFGPEKKSTFKPHGVLVLVR